LLSDRAFAVREWNKVFELRLDYFSVSLALLSDRVFAVREWNKVFELRLDYFSIPLALLSDHVVTNIAFRIDLKWRPFSTAYLVFYLCIVSRLGGVSTFFFFFFHS